MYGCYVEVVFHFVDSSQFTCGLIFIPTPAAKFLSWDRKVNSIDQTPSPPSDLKKGRSLARETKFNIVSFKKY